MQEQVTYYIDDLTGQKGDDVKTRVFGFDGLSYEIDLSDKNYTRLEKALAPFVEKARKVSTNGRRKSNGSKKMSREESRAIREWAHKKNKKVSDRGRIPEALVSEYHAGK